MYDERASMLFSLCIIFCANLKCRCLDFILDLGLAGQLLLAEGATRMQTPHTAF